jgi:hypothetical protein
VAAVAYVERKEREQPGNLMRLALSLSFLSGLCALSHHSIPLFLNAIQSAYHMRIEHLLFLFALFAIVAQALPADVRTNAIVVFQPPSTWIRDKVLSARSLLLGDVSAANRWASDDLSPFD